MGHGSQKLRKNDGRKNEMCRSPKQVYQETLGLKM